MQIDLTRTDEFIWTNFPITTKSLTNNCYFVHVLDSITHKMIFQVQHTHVLLWNINASKTASYCLHSHYNQVQYMPNYMPNCMYTALL